MSKILDPIAAAGRDMVMICGSFAPQGTGTPIVLSGKAECPTVLRLNPGQYFIFIDPPYKQLVSNWTSIQLATPADILMEWGGFAVQTVAQGSRWRGILYSTAAGVATDISADPSNIISWGAIFRRTGYET